MAKQPRKQQRADAQRIGDGGTGKLDRDAGADATVRQRSDETPASPTIDDVRARITRTRETAIEEFRRLGLSPETDDGTPRAAAESVLDEGDQAQASERQDLAFATRERVAERINRFTAALARIDEGTYGQCVVCGGAIEPARLAALPEADTCLACQERKEQAGGVRAA